MVTTLPNAWRSQGWLAWCRHTLTGRLFVGLLVGCLTSQQQASVSQGPICSDKFTCCPTEIEVADQTFHLTQLQYTDTGPTSPSTDPITPGAWQGSHWSANFEVTGMTRPRKKNPGVSGIRTRDLPLSRRTPQLLGQRGGYVPGNCPECLLVKYPGPVVFLVESYGDFTHRTYWGTTQIVYW